MAQEYLSTVQVASELAISQRRVCKLCEEGRLGQRVGGRYLITSDELKQFQKIPRNAGRKSTNPRRKSLNGKQLGKS